jgi:predicted NUDIX family NTP pyrophosphohydrolase
MQLSAGVVFITDNKILLGHSTGNRHWDIPKGHVEDNETPIIAAIRETKEESNTSVSENELEDLGEYRYRSDKKLHLFLCREKHIDITQFKCTSYFTHFSGKELPEIDKLQWFPFEEAIQQKLAKNMKRVITEILNEQNYRD